jgi:hypothetical protein
MPYGSSYKFVIIAQHNIAYLLKANTASKGVITGAKKSLLSSRAVWAQET